jgi:subtilisin family serine protease
VSENTTAPTRRLFTNGEALRIDVTAPNQGGGAKYEPVTVEQARRNLLPQIAEAVATARELPITDRLPGRVYVEARLLPNYLAPSNFPGALLTEIGAEPVGSRLDVADYRTASKTTRESTRRLLLAVADSGLEHFESIVRSGGRNRTEQQAVEQLRRLDLFALPSRSDVLRVPDDLDDSERTWEAVLHPADVAGGAARPLDNQDLYVWFNFVQSFGGHVVRDYVRAVGGLTFMPVVASRSVVNELARFNPLRTLRVMPALEPRPTFDLQLAPPLPVPASPQPVRSDVGVAVFDGGVDQTSGPVTHVPAVLVDLTNEPADARATRHGTGVTAAALFGLVNPGSVAPQPPLPVTSYRMLPPPAGDVEGYWMLDQIIEAVKRDGPRIVNLSLGPELAVEPDREPDRWTAELDQLAWDNDVLFVVASGNHGDKDRLTNLHRIQVPADMANGLAVGACDVPAPDRPWVRAPYSSMGPGRAGRRIQPAGVQFGGVTGRPFPGLRSDGTFFAGTGTSFAAPVTTHALADLVTRLPRSNSSVLRAFAVHFAERHRTPVKLRDELGFGRHPLSFADHLDSSADEVHVLFVDTAARHELRGYRLPVPSATAGTLLVRLTLAFASPIAPTEATEYTTASLDLALRPHRFIHRINPPRDVDAEAVVLDVRSARARDLFAEGWTQSQEPVTRTINGTIGKRVPEHELREAGKWETIRRYDFSIDGADLLEPRLELSYVARQAAGIDSSPTEVPFALLVSITDTSNSATLHDRTSSEFAALRPVQQVQGRVRLRGTGASAVWY